MTVRELHPEPGTTELNIKLDRCTGCSLCVMVCPSSTLSVIEGKAVATGSHCMQCGHCMAACPYGAITLTVLDRASASFRTFTPDSAWLPPGKFDTAKLVQLMQSRRSIRNFSTRTVPLELLEDLVKIGITAPSGTNSQSWTFTILPERRQVLALADKVADFFTRINRQAKNPLLRLSLKMLGKPQLQHYYKRHYQTVADALAEWHEHGRDHLFHGAPAALLVGSKTGASCPVEDALLATQNILLAAHSMGLGTCLIGYVVEAMKRDASIGRSLSLTADERVHAVIAIGYGTETYQHPAVRKKINPRIVRL